MVQVPEHLLLLSTTQYNPWQLFFCGWPAHTLKTTEKIETTEAFDMKVGDIFNASQPASGVEAAQCWAGIYYNNLQPKAMKHFQIQSKSNYFLL